MNRFKKEEARKRQNARKGLSLENLNMMNQEEAHQEKLVSLARKIHANLFAEEYSFIYADSFGEPKLSKQDIMKKNSYRLQYDLPLLDEHGQTDDFQGATLRHCYTLATDELK